MDLTTKGEGNLPIFRFFSGKFTNYFSIMEEITQKKSGRGGARPGAGRPRKNIVKSYAFHAPPEVHEILEKVQGSKSEFICQCILKAAQLS